jgi:3-oxoacyl-[acyl-carrier protein] reductase
MTEHWCVFPHMPTQRTGRVVNIGSNFGLTASNMDRRYATTKATVINLTKSLCPSPVNSAINRGLALRHGLDSDEVSGNWRQAQAMRDRLPTKDSVAAALLHVGTLELGMT